MVESKNVKVECPCCQASLLVNTRTGLVLHSEKKKLDYSFENAVQDVEDRKQKAAELFDKAFVDEKKRQQGLEEKFREALKSKDELDDPIRPWDLD